MHPSLDHPSSTGHFAKQLPFDHEKLDELLEASKIDVLVVTSKHNIQYLLGGYKFFFFDQSDAIGVSRYLPILIYPKGQPEKAIYIGNAMEDSEAENRSFWCTTVETSSWGTLDAMETAVKHLKRLNISAGTIGVEFPFLPSDAADHLRGSMDQSHIVDAHFALERLRARKTQSELSLIQAASNRVVDSMIATFKSIRPGLTKRQIASELKRQEIDRDLVFEYCLITSGPSLNRAPSDQTVVEGDILSLDSGGRFKGYIGDLCRMGILGTPDSELEDLLAEVEAIQQAARTAIRPGSIGRDIFASAEPLLNASPNKKHIHFVAHGMGIIGHEAPRLSSRGPVPYPAYDAGLPLEAGMVLSVETTLLHPVRGFIKLEDTLAVTETGYEAFGDEGRGWNQASF